MSKQNESAWTWDNEEICFHLIKGFVETSPDPIKKEIVLDKLSEILAATSVSFIKLNNEERNGFLEKTWSNYELLKKQEV